MNIIFLDFDGVVRVDESSYSGWGNGPNAQFCQQRMKWLSQLCFVTGAKIVVSSDWRDFGKNECIGHLRPHLHRHLHIDWQTPQLHTRWEEVQSWLQDHGEVEKFLILDDRECLFDGAPAAIRDHLILCNNRHGLTVGHMPGLYQLLSAPVSRESN